MVFRSRRQSRYISLLNSGFMRFEAAELSRISFAEAPYLRRMMADRRQMQRSFIDQATAMRWSQSKTLDEWRQVIRSEYMERGWLQERTKLTTFRTAYKASPWAMLRDYRQKAIEQGEYFPNPDRKQKRKKSVATLSDMIRARSSRRASKERERQRRLNDPDAMAKYRQQRRQQRLRARQREIRG